MDSLTPSTEATTKARGRSVSPSSVAHRAKNGRHAGVMDAPPVDYDELGIPAGAVPVFEEAREMFASIGRKRTDEVFACGELLSRAREKTTQEAFERWSKSACHLTRRGADNYISVHRRLSRHRKLFVKCSVPAAAMYTLANAEQGTLASVIAVFESGERPTVREIKALVSAETGVERPDSADIAGADGLKALAREKSRKAIPVLIGRLQTMLSDTREALEPHFAGKKVAKGALVRKLEHPARRARAELQSLAVFVEPYSAGDTWRVYPVQFPSGSRWADVSSILYKLGGHEDWPDADELGTWLASEVLPALEFAAGMKQSKVVNAAE